MLSTPTMTQTLFHRWFGTGKVPQRYRTDLEAEGLLHVEEGIRVTTTFKRLKSPGRYTKRKTRSCTGSIALSPKRLIGFGGPRTAIHIPFDHASYGKLSFSVELGNVLLIEFDAEDFYEQATGYAELRFEVDDAAAFLDRLTSAKRAHDEARDAGVSYEPESPT